MSDAQMEIMPTPQRSFGLRIAALAAAGATLTMVACSDDENNTTLAGDATETTVALDSAEEKVANELCPEGFSTDMLIKAEFDLSKVGSENALLPSFSKVEDGVAKIDSPETVADTIMTLACDHPTILAIFDAIHLQTAGFNETGRYSLPDETLLKVIEERARLFRENEPAALKALENLASILTVEGGMEYVKDFNVIAGNAVIVTTEREADGDATQIQTVPVTTEGLMDVFRVVYNGDTAETAEQRATLKAISELVGYRPNGEVIIADWIGEGTTGFEIDVESEDTVPVDTAIDESEDTTNVDGNNEDDSSEEDEEDDSSSDNGDNTGTNGGGGGSGGSGDGSCGGGCGTGGDGTTPGTGPNTTNTPTTVKPPTTTVWTTNPATTTIVVTVPQTTTPNTVPPTTTIKPKDPPTTPTTAPPPPGF